MTFREYYKKSFLYKIDIYWRSFSNCFEDIGGSLINLFEIVFWICIFPLIILVTLISPIFNFFTVKKCKDCGSKKVFITIHKKNNNIMFCEECFEKRFYKKELKNEIN